MNLPLIFEDAHENFKDKNTIENTVHQIALYLEKDSRKETINSIFQNF